ncbi:DUF934 domain-containing protein [Pseudomonas sp. JQ170]|uniref:DUF934 domain-containing protein n=1 Tax=unclassified Pseudomonas TaxID=196821 RepID=UPI00265322B2|nr:MULTISPECIES: DUF934 domain-containing protein [unclassified Pseudomonas]MDN7142020.1 DUF934 domain-containing protein [Pseudomonas sp. JQ170]WRO78315.1 DUF934 domain-containing protein [Pseudomonas sp. 170C]
MRNVIALRNGEAQLLADDGWQLLRHVEQLLPEGLLILPLADWLDREAQQPAGRDGLWLGPDDEIEALEPWLAQVALIAIDFPSFRDGRGYSQAYLLRTRLGWQGELRAVGDVLRDQLSHMRQCGFDSFAVREDKCAEDALKGLAGMSVLYGRSVIEPRPLFRRR